MVLAAVRNPAPVRFLAYHLEPFGGGAIGSTSCGLMAPSYDFAGRTAVVTGGAGGIGRAVAALLRDAGANVWVWDLVPPNLDGVRAVLADLTDEDAVRAALATTTSDAPTIDILVNSIGSLGTFGQFEQQAADEWSRIAAVNLLAVFRTCRAVLPAMRLGAGGHIVNMGSLAGKHGLAGLAVYSAASAGVIAFTKALAEEVADANIVVNCVTPGPIDTTLITSLDSGVVDAMIRSSPMHRLGTAEEVAELVGWLCSEANTFSTGAVFDLSGGRAKY